MKMEVIHSPEPLITTIRLPGVSIQKTIVKIFSTVKMLYLIFDSSNMHFVSKGLIETNNNKAKKVYFRIFGVSWIFAS
jgi:hypothetical protein